MRFAAIPVGDLVPPSAPGLFGAAPIQAANGPFAPYKPPPGEPAAPEVWVELQPIGKAPEAEPEEAAGKKKGWKKAIPGTGVTLESGEKGKGASLKRGDTTYGFTETSGPYIKGMTPFKGGPSFDWSADEQALHYKVPGSGFAFPPPQGKWEGPKGKVQIPFGTAPFGVELGGGLTAGVTVNELAIDATLKRAAGGETVVNTMEITGQSSAKATVGGDLDLGLWGGVPHVATGSVGGRVSPSLSVNLKGKVGGSFQIKHTKEEEPTEIDRKGAVQAGLDGSGVIEAALKAYFAGRILVFEKDLFEIKLKSAEIAKISAAAVVGREWAGKGTPGKNFARPAVGDPAEYFQVTWLLQEAFEARKVAKAREAAIEATGDVQALESLLQAIASGDKSALKLPGRLRLMQEKTDGLLDELREATDAIESNQEEIAKLEGLGASKGAKIVVGKDEVAIDKRIKDLRKEIGKARERIESREAEIPKLYETMNELWFDFVAQTDVGKIQMALEKAQAREAATTASLGRLYREKLGKLAEQTAKKLNAVTAEHAEIQRGCDRLRRELASEKSEGRKKVLGAALKEENEKLGKQVTRMEKTLEEHQRLKEKLESSLTLPS